MLVVVIIGMLAAIAVPNIAKRLDVAQVNTTRGTIKALDSAVDGFMLDHSAKLPNSLQELLPYLKNAQSVPKDAYGNDLSYTPNHSDGSYKIVSPGKDNSLGTADDITN
jgi:general secretion pathway protein G